MAETTTTTSLPARRVRGDVIGDGADAVGVGDRGAAELLDEKHGNQGYRRPGAPPKDSRRVHSAPMPSADKRARQKENARCAPRAARGRARSARSATGRSSPSAIVVGGLRRRVDPAHRAPAATARRTTRPRHVRPAGHAPRRASAAASDTQACDPTKTYTATIDHDFGTITIQLDAKDAPKAANSFVFLAKQGLLRRSRVAPDPEGLRDPGRRPERRPERRTGYPVGRRASRRASTSWATSRSPRPTADPNGTSARSSSSSPATQGVGTCRPTTPTSARSRGHRRRRRRSRRSDRWQRRARIGDATSQPALHRQGDDHRVVVTRIARSARGAVGELLGRAAPR